MRQKERG